MPLRSARSFASRAWASTHLPDTACPTQRSSLSIGVLGLDQRRLRRAVALLEVLLARNAGERIRMALEIDQLVDFVTRGEGVGINVVLVFPHALLEHAAEADVGDAAMARHDVDVEHGCHQMRRVERI